MKPKFRTNKLLLIVCITAVCMLLFSCGTPSGNVGENTDADAVTTAHDAEVTTSAPEPEPEPEISTLYSFKVSASSDINNRHIKTNSSLYWLKQDYLDNDPGKLVNVMRIYNTRSSKGGLPEGESLTIDFPEAPDINTAETAGVHLFVEYCLVSEDDDYHVGAIDKVQVFVSTDNGATWEEKTAGMLSHTLIGTTHLIDHNSEGLVYEIVTEDIAALVEDGKTITDIRFKPFGDHPYYNAAFRLVEVSLKEYSIPMTKDQTEYIEVSEETLRAFAVAQAHKIGEIEWISDKKIDTMNYSEVGDNVTDLPMIYYPGYLHKGPLYTRVDVRAYENILDIIDQNKKYTGPVDSDHAIGMNCSGFAIDVTSRFVASCGSAFRSISNGDKLVDSKHITFVAPLSNPKMVRNTTEILKEFTDQEIYQHYANMKPGDVAIRYPDNNHIRVVTSEPVVEYMANGSINPLKSYVLMSEAGGISHYYFEKPDGSIVRQEIDPAKYLKANPTHKFLYGASCKIDEKYTFAQLRTTDYVALYYNEYAEEKIEALNITANCLRKTFADIKRKGFIAVVQSNYRIINLELKLLDKDGGELYSKKIVPKYYMFETPVTDTALDAKIKELPAGEYTIAIDVKSGPQYDINTEIATTRALEYAIKVK